MDWERRLKAVFDGIDAVLEERYGSRYPLHPARPARGRTADPEQDGLFNVGAAYSAGFGSTRGGGYVVEVRLATFALVPPAVRREIEDEVAAQLRRRLPRAFPGRRLEVAREGPVYKIVGDFALGVV